MTTKEDKNTNTYLKNTVKIHRNGNFEVTTFYQKLSNRGKLTNI